MVAPPHFKNRREATPALNSQFSILSCKSQKQCATTGTKNRLTV